MLTRCVEKGREKCDHYWPYDTQPVFYGDIQVTILNESHFPDWNISEFRMMRGDTVRTIRHFHFTTWPDFGVPEPPQTLVRFVRAYRERVTAEQRPVVVHCSAGVGRSGTFIALDRILQVSTIRGRVEIKADPNQKCFNCSLCESTMWLTFSASSSRCAKSVFGWSRRNSNIFAYISASWQSWKAKRTTLRFTRFTRTKDLRTTRGLPSQACEEDLILQYTL